MSIRSRLTLSFAVLAALSVLAAAIVGYTSTSTRVRSEIDSTLREVVGRAIGPGPDGRVCRSLLDVAPPGANDGGGDRQRRHAFDLPDARAQCIDEQGSVLVDDRLLNDPTRALPVDDRDRAIARQRIDEESVAAEAGQPLSRVVRIPGVDAPKRSALSRGVRLRSSKVDSSELRIATGGVAGGGAFMVARDLKESDRVLGALRDRFALIGLLVTLVAAALGAFVARAFARPIHMLTEVTSSIASSGGLDNETAIEPGITARRDELGRLAHSFSSMIGSLRTSRAQQRQLAQDAGHELRTPLTTLRTNVEVLAKYPDLPAEKRATILHEMDEELRELSTLTDELLVLAADATPDDPVVSIDLAELVTRSIERFQRRTGRSVRSTATTTMLRGRRLQLSRAIDNILANSAKFDPTSFPIEATVDPGRISVRDHGPGFESADLDRVFDRFFRSDAARSLSGTGLGLAIVADAAASHHGTATASNHPDGGAVVTLTLHDADSPVAPPQAG